MLLHRLESFVIISLPFALTSLVICHGHSQKQGGGGGLCNINRNLEA